MKCVSRIFQMIWLLGFIAPVWGQRPVIAHDAPPSVAAGQRLRLIARVSAASPLDRVTLHLAQSGGVAPVTLPMEPSGGGIFSVTVSPSLFSGASSFRYYIEAHTQEGDWAETDWFTVRVIGTIDEEGGSQTWIRPALIGLGAAAGVGAAIVLSDSGGGSGGDSEVPPGTDPADLILVRTASDRVDGPAEAAPRETIVDVADELRGRRINRIRIRIEFDPVDEGEEIFEMAYNNRVVFSGLASGGPRTDQVEVAGTDDTRVFIRVTNSQDIGGNFAYRWTATVTYFLSP